jgi:hypothetical protein
MLAALRSPNGVRSQAIVATKAWKRPGVFPGAIGVMLAF